jgi:hypothetical protein
MVQELSLSPSPILGGGSSISTTPPSPSINSLLSRARAAAGAAAALRGALNASIATCGFSSPQPQYCNAHTTDSFKANTMTEHENCISMSHNSGETSFQDTEMGDSSVQDGILKISIPRLSPAPPELCQTFNLNNHARGSTARHVSTRHTPPSPQKAPPPPPPPPPPLLLLQDRL